MILRFDTALDCTAEAAWAAMRKKDTFFYVTKGFLSVSGADAFPDVGGEGAEFEGRLLLFGFLPAWRHRITVVRVDPARREIRTNESGGPMRVWNHTLRAEPKGPDRSVYTDEIEFRAGVLTPLMVPYVWVLFHYRQIRWRSLARRLGAAEGTPAVERVEH